MTASQKKTKQSVNRPCWLLWVHHRAPRGIIACWNERRKNFACGKINNCSLVCVFPPFFLIQIEGKNGECEAEICWLMVVDARRFCKMRMGWRKGRTLHLISQSEWHSKVQYSIVQYNNVNEKGNCKALCGRSFCISVTGWLTAGQRERSSGKEDAGKDGSSN